MRRGEGLKACSSSSGGVWGTREGECQLKKKKEKKKEKRKPKARKINEKWKRQSRGVAVEK